MSSPNRRRGGPATPASDGGSARSPADLRSPQDVPEDAPEDASDFERVASDEESEGEDLMDENMMDDYKRIDELDEYEAEGVDEGEYEEIDEAARRRAEARMRKRDREDARRAGGVLDALRTPDEEEELPARARRRILEEGEPGEELGSPSSEAAEEEFVNLDEYKGPLNEWITMDRTRKEIKRRFRQFIEHYKGTSDHTLYPSHIIAQCRENRSSVEISFLHLSDATPVLAVWIADEPEQMLEILNEEIYTIALKLFPKYSEIQKEMYVRITQLPIVDRLRDLRQSHLNCLIRVEGVVIRRSGVFPQLSLVSYLCLSCNNVTGQYTQTGGPEVKPNRCAECQKPGPFAINTKETVFRNYQKITLQESPGSVPAGRVPRQKDVILLHDLIDSVSPGEMVDITGIYKHTYDVALNTQNGFPVFSTILQANYVQKHTAAMASFKLTDDDVTAIHNLAKRPNIADLIIDSIGPSICGHRNIKTALALSMFSGEPKQFENGHRIRGDINVLVLGDPGTAKSQFLKYVEKTSHRAVYTTGKGASAVGLTASVHKDPFTREWTLEGGALVLADQGICLIDEFDKMNDQDRTSIHEAMEQQSISVSKAGIITTLKARCAVIAAANPTMGRYDSSRTFAENVELTDAILSRFDILCVVRDTVDFELDGKLAEFVVDSHRKATLQQPEQEAEKPQDKDKTSIPQELLKKYIMYAREHCHPTLAKIDDNKISKLYADLRRESMVTGGIPIAVRHIESMIRMSESHAKMHLRQVVTEEDVNVAIGVMLESFIGSQKFSVMRPLRNYFQQYLVEAKDTFELLYFSLHQLITNALDLKRLVNEQRPESQRVKIDKIEIKEEEFKAKAAALRVHNLEEFYKSKLFAENGLMINRQRKTIIKTL